MAMDDVAERDRYWLRYAFDLARRSVLAGDQPFGAVLVGPAGTPLIEAMNTRTTDLVGHAETSVARQAAISLPLDLLAQSTLYSSTEPCLMCAGAIGWSGVGTVVFGLSQARMNTIPGGAPRFPRTLSLRDLLGGLQPAVIIRGPLLEDEALGLHL
jgi:tRNA(Arg) A34 adenosine deaminase TadA